MIRGVGLFATVVLVSACRAGASGSPEVAPASPPAQEVLTFAGEGTRASDTTQLAAGDYRLEWTATASGHGCVFGLSLEPIGHDEFVSPALELVADAETVTGSTVVDLDGGQYVANVEGEGCAWSVSIARP